MGSYMRKSFGAGPFRTTISKSGTSVSVGGKGCRVGYYSSNKSRKKTRKNELLRSNTNTVETTEAGRKVFAWVCRICFIPMILFGMLLTIVTPVIGIMSIVVGILELIYSYRYFKQKKTSNY